MQEIESIVSNTNRGGAAEGRVIVAAAAAESAEEQAECLLFPIFFDCE